MVTAPPRIVKTPLPPAIIARLVAASKKRYPAGMPGNAASTFYAFHRAHLVASPSATFKIVYALNRACLGTSQADTVKLVDALSQADPPAPASGLGDVNMDGKVDIGDIIGVERIVLGLDNDPQHIRRASVFGPARGVDIGAAVAIENFILGLIPCLPYDAPTVFKIGSCVQLKRQPDKAIWQITSYDVNQVIPDLGNGLFYLDQVRNGTDYNKLAPGSGLSTIIPFNDMVNLFSIVNFPTVVDRIQASKTFIDTLYQSDGIYGYIKEYPGLPLGIYVRETKEARLLGDWRMSLAGYVMTPVSNITGLTAYPETDGAVIGFDDRAASLIKPGPDFRQPNLTASRNYLNKTWKFIVQYFLDYLSPAYHVDVFLTVPGGEMLLYGNLGLTTSPAGMTSPAIYNTAPCFPCNRYTVRHGAALGRWLYIIWGDSTKASRLLKLRSDFGFTYDIYDPLFGQSANQADDFIFTVQAYHDNLQVWSQLPRGRNPGRYPYLSKVQRDPLGGTLAAYITTSTQDPLAQCLQAIHILNKYNDPNHLYRNSTPSSITAPSLTPTGVAQSVYAKYNGVGIASPLGPSNYGSAVRTAAFLTLATLLGYKYGNANMATAADKVFDSLTNTATAPQAGLPPLMPGHIFTLENGNLHRPAYAGSYYGVWTKSSLALAVTSQGSILDILNMPSEEPGPIPSNQESTVTVLQALRVYAHYALGIDAPNANLIPGTDKPYIPLKGTIAFYYLDNNGVYQPMTDASVFPVAPVGSVTPAVQLALKVTNTSSIAYVAHVAAQWQDSLGIIHDSVAPSRQKDQVVQPSQSVFFNNDPDVSTSASYFPQMAQLIVGGTILASTSCILKFASIQAKVK